MHLHLPSSPRIPEKERWAAVVGIIAGIFVALLMFVLPQASMVYTEGMLGFVLVVFGFTSFIMAKMTGLHYEYMFKPFLIVTTLYSLTCFTLAYASSGKEIGHLVLVIASACSAAEYLLHIIAVQCRKFLRFTGTALRGTFSYIGWIILTAFFLLFFGKRPRHDTDSK